MVLSVTPTCAISGSIRKEDGLPAAGARVVALLQRTTARGTRLTQSPEQLTDDRGSYRLYGLAPGRYTVAVVRAAETAGAEVLPLTFFPGAIDPGTAQYFDVRAGDEHTGVDFVITEAATYTLSGAISGLPDSWDGERAVVWLTTKGPVHATIATAMTEVDGSFKLLNLPSGDYQITAFGPASRWTDSGTLSGSSIRAGSGSALIDGADQHTRIELRELPVLEGQFIFLDGASRAVCGDLDHISFHPEDGWPDIFAPAIRVRNDRFKADGIPSGHYTIEMPGLEEPCRLIQVLIGNQLVTLGGPLLDGAAPIRLAITAAHGSVFGTIVNMASPGAGAGMVVLLEQDGGYAPQTAPVDLEGRYQFKAVPPGQYLLKASRTNSRLITVEAGKNTTADLKMEP